MDGEEFVINGLTEYGYGYWSRWLWNGYTKKVVDKTPHCIAMSRFTVNRNYQGDARELGDRTLSIWVCNQVYHYTTYNLIGNNVNLWKNVPYDVNLDGQWNYIYFSYKRINSEKGAASGFVALDGVTVRQPEYNENVLHYPINDYLYFAVGTSGEKLIKNYNKFNGQFSQVRLFLGEGAFIPDVDALREWFASDAPKPEFPDLKKISEKVVGEIEDSSRADTAVEPIEFEDEFAGQIEYSVSLWHKWTPIARATWEVIYTLTYNEPDFRANHVRAGDRVLSMFQYQDHRVFFSSYTTPNVHDAFAHVHAECPTPSADQTQWVYSYFGYSRKE